MGACYLTFASRARILRMFCRAWRWNAVGETLLEALPSARNKILGQGFSNTFYLESADATP